MKSLLSNFAACIGLDWADQKHDICLQAANTETFEFEVLTHSPEAIDEWAHALQQRFNNQPVAICLELKTGPVVYALLKYKFITLFPIPPKALAKYREAFTQNGAKDDPTDAYLQLDYLLKHSSALKQLNPDDKDTRILQRLVEDRRAFVADKVRLSNRLTAALKSYYPQALQWFDDIDTPLFCDFIQAWPTLKQAQRARHTTLIKFFKSHRCVRDTVIKKRSQAIKTAMPLTEDEGVIVPFAQLVLALTVQLQQTLATIHDYDLDIARRFRGHDDHDIFASLPGAGPAMAPRLLAAFAVNVTDIRTLMSSIDSRALRRYLIVVALIPGRIGDILALSSCVKRLLSGRIKPSAIHSGLESSMIKKERKVSRIKPVPERWLLNGYVLSLGVGKTKHLMMNQRICLH